MDSGCTGRKWVTERLQTRLDRLYNQFEFNVGGPQAGLTSYGRREMNQKGQEVLEAALTLPEDERAMIAEALLQTLPPGPNDWDEDELANELDRRLEEALRDPTATIPWSAPKK
jgi:putative addiction module component (TIGR02574 family)